MIRIPSHFLSTVAAFALCTSLPVHAAPGDLDTSGFGSGFGTVITAIGSRSDWAYATTLQPDGKVVVAGLCDVGSDIDFCLARYLPTGALDTSFNTTGKVITAIGSSLNLAFATVMQPDGKIVVAGQCRNGVGNYDFCLARYLPNGALDTSFNTTGKIITTIGSSGDSVSSMALQPDGKIVVVGSCYNGINNQFCLARYLPNGTLDTSFNGTGTVLTANGSFDDHTSATALQPDGKIIVAGYCLSSYYNFCLARYLPSGALDTSFNGTGSVITDIGSVGWDQAYATALQPDGKIVAVGTCSIDGKSKFCLARYLASGVLDTSFNSSGKVITAIGLNDDFARAVALQPDGKIVAVGHCFIGGKYEFCLARYLPSGELDTSFIGTGKVTTAIGSGQAKAYSVALQSDGKIVVVGTCDNGGPAGFCLARYEGGPFDARNCSMDIDGDNRVLATTDVLIGARVALGITGNAVLAGINFASHATRTTWPTIRDYLVSQCGMSIVP